MKSILIDIPNYLTQVELSKKRRTSYTPSGKISKTSGTPKYHRIAGNDLWSSLNPHIRAKILKEIKLWFYSNYVKHLEALTEFPIKLTFTFYGKLGDLDLDNLDIFYRKAFLDCLAGHVKQQLVASDSITTKGATDKEWDMVTYPNKIPDDSVHFIREITSKYVEAETPRLTINIETIDRDSE